MSFIWVKWVHILWDDVIFDYVMIELLNLLFLDFPLVSLRVWFKLILIEACN